MVPKATKKKKKPVTSRAKPVSKPKRTPAAVTKPKKKAAAAKKSSTKTRSATKKTSSSSSKQKQQQQRRTPKRTQQNKKKTSKTSTPSKSSTKSGGPVTPARNNNKNAVVNIRGFVPDDRALRCESAQSHRFLRTGCVPQIGDRVRCAIFVGDPSMRRPLCDSFCEVTKVLAPPPQLTPKQQKEIAPFLLSGAAGNNNNNNDNNTASTSADGSSCFGVPFFQRVEAEGVFGDLCDDGAKQMLLGMLGQENCWKRHTLLLEMDPRWRNTWILVQLDGKNVVCLDPKKLMASTR